MNEAERELLKHDARWRRRPVVVDRDETAVDEEEVVPAVEPLSRQEIRGRLLSDRKVKGDKK